MKPQLDARRASQLQAIAIGASAGGIDALFSVLEPLPKTARLPVVVVLHLPQEHESKLAEIFAMRLALRCEEARPGIGLVAGTVYFAPAGYHLLVEPDATFSLNCDPPVLYSRPSVDVLFESCAHAFGAGLLAIVLTGANDDGARGLAQVRQAGGVAVVQDPADAAHAWMPRAALDFAGADLVLPLSGIAELLHTVQQA